APHLEFAAHGPGGAYELSVEAGFGRDIVSAAGQLSPDRQTLTFTGVDLAIPEPGSASALWVPVTADAGCPLDVTALLYTVGNEPCLSTPVHITDGLVLAPGAGPGDRGSFQASPAGPPDITLTPGGTAGYPAVRLMSTGQDPVTPRYATVILPPGKGLTFTTAASGQYEIAVITGDGQTHTYPAALVSGGQSLASTAPVDLGLPAPTSVSALWTGISAQGSAAPGDTACAFTISDQYSPSTPIHITTGGGGGGETLIPQNQMSVHWVDSEETRGENAPATNVLDGSADTYWHTQWQGANPPTPHQIVLDLGGSYNVTSLYYLPRQNSVNGRIADYQIYTSTDAATWTQAAAGTFTGNPEQQKAALTPTTARYIRLTALREINGNPWTSAAEINIGHQN
ncbi:discoidin domain-containing protein, partial [Kitasatospora sp. NPDC058243]|uniref:discoidin domain-containing protein n=1 Tax=Kitasatospora sp. NPDC058243 TaxID=3346397 RepID=UPI0036DEF82B